MKTMSIQKIIRWIANVIGGVILALFLFMIVAHIFGSEKEKLQGALTAWEISIFVFLGITLLGLAVAYFRPLLGGCLTVGGSFAMFLSFIIKSEQILPPPRFFFFYILLLVGILNVIVGFLIRQMKRKE